MSLGVNIHYINFFNLRLVESLNGIILLILAVSILLIVISNSEPFMRVISLVVTYITMFFYLWLLYIYSDVGAVITVHTLNFNLCSYIFHLDNLAVIFACMTAFIIPFCIIYSERTTSIGTKYLLSNILLTELLILICFTTRNLLIFFIAFESVIIPMMFLILCYGSRGRKLYAFMSFFLYTFFGSIFLLIGIILLLMEGHTLNFDSYTIIAPLIEIQYRMAIMVVFLIGFAVKVPTMPLHSWLPEAHVEAPTAGSVILASLLLKLGGYGVIRIVLPLSSDVLMQWRIVPITLCVISSLYATFLAFRNFDTKKIIAYSSIAHMNLSMIGLFMESKSCFIGAVLSMLAHSLIAGALFFIAGFMYEKYSTRNVVYYASLYRSLYFLYFFIFFFIFSNMSMPGICSFIGELLIYVGIGATSTSLLFLTAPIMFFTGLFSCVLLYRLIYFNSEMHNLILQKKLHQIIALSSFNLDLAGESVRFLKSEYIIVLVLSITSLLLFFFPDIFITMVSASASFLIY